MLDTFYRFRSVDALLDEFHELKNQEIYFANPSELNDPMEGFSDTFWDGDKIIWENFLKHYLVCLDRAFSILLIGGESACITWDQIPIIDPGDNRYFTPQHQSIQDAIFQRFIEEPVVSQYITCLAERGGISRPELSMHLAGLHWFALLVVKIVYAKNNLFDDDVDRQDEYQSCIAQLNTHIKLFDLFKDLHKEKSTSEEMIFSLSSVSRNMREQIYLINILNGTINSSAANKKFVLIDFSDGYLDQVQRIIYPDWYSASFMSDCKNSSIWGTYGDKHTAVCLKFRAEVRGDISFIALNRTYGLGSSGEILGDVEHQFHKVEYSKKHVAIDFFRSIGSLPRPTMNKYWYTNKNGDVSQCAKSLTNDEELWRNSHWENFQKMSTSKLEDWRFENEYRLLLTGSILDFSKPAQRKAKYSFNSLDGIIFGINTLLEIKQKIVQIIEAKCREHGRQDFKFYQAYYDRQKGTIEHAELGLLKFKFN